jgi:hypothetical protein
MFRLSTITIVVLILLACTTIVQAQKEKPGRDPLRLVDFQNVDLVAIVHALAGGEQVPIGFEVDPKKARSPISIHLTNARTREILDGLIRVEPAYQWRDGGDFIEVFPVSGRSVFLDTPVNGFDLKDVSHNQAINQLLSRPEVEAIMNSMSLKRQPVPAGLRDQESRFSVHLESTSLRQALNQIAKASGTNFWVFRTYPDGSFAVSVSVDRS